MKEFELKYGCNPNQKPSKIYMKDGSDLPITILNGRPGYINFLDAFNSWQLVKEIKEATGMPAATSFKHVSPTSAAVGVPMSDALKKACFVDDIEGLDDSAIATAYARARGTDRMCSFGDWIALSDVCDVTTANLIKREVSDGIIAPGYEPEALEILKSKKKGNYNVVQIDPNYVPNPQETKDVYGVTFEQGRNDFKVTDETFANIVTEKKELPAEAKRDLTIALLTLKYTQSNSVCYVVDGQAIGVGAGQQSRIHCTRLAGDKADHWLLRQTEQVLNLPFKDSGSKTASAVRRETTPSTSTCPRTMKTSSAMENGKPCSPNSRLRSSAKTRERTSRPSPESPSVLTRSSRSLTTLSVPTSPASPTSPSPAAPSAMTSSSKPATTWTWSWPSPVSACSTTKLREASLFSANRTPSARVPRKKRELRSADRKGVYKL